MANPSPPAQGIHSLATLIKRLEAAASRIEDAAFVFDSSAHTNQAPSSGREPAQAPDSHTASSAHSAPPPPPSPPPPAPTAAPVPETPKTVLAFQEQVIDAKLKPFVEFSKSFAGPNVVDTVGLVQKEFTILEDFLKLAGTCQKPDQSTQEALLSPFPPAIAAVSRAQEVHRRDREWGQHLSALGAGAPVIGWVVNPKPVPFVVEQKESVVYYGNRIKKEYKEKDPKHIQWVNLYLDIFDGLSAYIKEYHTTGVTWNPKGITTAQYKSSASSAASPPPPPPPPPAPAAPAGTSGSTPAPAGGAAAVFADLNRGEAVTKGLRKVDKSEMTHKNPALRASSVVPASTSSPVVAKKPAKPMKPSALAGKKPAKFALEGNKWMIEFQENDTITVEDVEISQSVNIFGCKGATVLIKGKVNAVNILNSTKTAVLVHSVVSSISITSSPSFQLQVTGTAPMIQLDSTDSGQIYLSKDSINAEITTAKCSAINVSLPVEGEEDGIFEEQAVPEMFKTVVVDGKLVTTVVEHSG